LILMSSEIGERSQEEANGAPGESRKGLISFRNHGKVTPKTPLDYGTCTIEPAKVPDHPVQSTFTASYPGSGAKMTWKLIEAMTGFVTGDDFQLNGHENIVSIKTHYPSNEGRPLPGSKAIPRAILLIRHPLYSIPSYFNFLYEYQNGLEGHSTRAPLEEWIKWRNDNFDRQLQVWLRHTEYWLENFKGSNRLVVQYERLTDDESGPKVANHIARFLEQSNGVSSRSSTEIPCIWNMIVKYKNNQQAGQTTDLQSKRGGPKYITPFDKTQLREMMGVLSNLLESYRNDASIHQVLVEYIDEVARRAEGPPEDENTNVS